MFKTISREQTRHVHMWLCSKPVLPGNIQWKIVCILGHVTYVNGVVFYTYAARKAYSRRKRKAFARSPAYLTALRPGQYLAA